MAKILYVDPSKCTGCRTCELVCSIKNEGIANSVLSRIRIVAEKYEGLRIPMLCQQCQDAPCISVCPVGALRRDKKLGVVKHDKDRCIDCKVCVQACPFGGIAIAPQTGHIFKCELCDGEPECVRFCVEDAITYVEPDVIVMDKKRQAIQNLSPLFEKYSGHEGIIHAVKEEG